MGMNRDNLPSSDEFLPKSLFVLIVDGDAADGEGTQAALARLGVGSAPHPGYDMADWVLSAFQNEDAETIRAAAENAAKACVCFIEKGPDKAMTQFNTRK